MLGQYVEEHYPVSAEKLAAEKEDKEQKERAAGEKGEWDRREQAVDGMSGLDKVKQDEGEVKAAAARPAKGEGKLRLAQEWDDEVDEDGEQPAHSVLHVADEDEDGSTAKTGSAHNPKGDAHDDDEPLAPLLADAKKKLDALYPAPTSSTSSPSASTTTSTQTPPHAEPTSTGFARPAFVAQQPAAEKKRSGHEWPAVDGSVQHLTPEDLAVLTDEETPASFVKYYAPWCSHCKQLSPSTSPALPVLVLAALTLSADRRPLPPLLVLVSPAEWKELAEVLAPAGVHVYEVDCDAAENKRACRTQGVQGYPTLKLCVPFLFLLPSSLRSLLPSPERQTDELLDALVVQLQQGRVGRVPGQARRQVARGVRAQGQGGVRPSSALLISCVTLERTEADA